MNFFQFRVVLLVISIAIGIFFKIVSRETINIKNTDYQFGINLFLYSFVLISNKLSEHFEIIKIRGIVQDFENFCFGGVLLLIDIFLVWIISSAIRKAEQDYGNGKKLSKISFCLRAIIFPNILGIIFLFFSLNWSIR